MWNVDVDIAELYTGRSVTEVLYRKTECVQEKQCTEGK